MKILALFFLTACAAAQNLAEPQYQLTGQNYKMEAPAIQQMFYNVASAVKATNASVTANAGVTKIVAGTGIAVSPSGGTGSVTVSATGGGTTGISSSCAAGFYLSTSTFVNGVATGGGCVAVPTTLPPNGVAGGDLTGNYPNPTLTATQANVKILSGLTTISNAYTSVSSETNMSAGGIASLSGGFSGSSGTFTNGVTASSGTFTQTGVGNYSILASSAINILAGGVKWPDGTVSTTASSSGGNFVSKSGDSMTGPLTMLSASTITISGTGFSVGVSTFIVRGGLVGISTGLPQQALDVIGAIQESGGILTGPTAGGVVPNARGSGANDLCIGKLGGTDIPSGSWSSILGGYNNGSQGAFDVMGGGRANGETDDYDVLGGGRSNVVSGQYAFIGGGQANGGGGGGEWSVITGGTSNTCKGTGGFVGSGTTNHGDANYGVIGGGSGNHTANGNAADYSTIGGGNGNVTGNGTGSASEATVGGGNANAANGQYSTVGGGNGNAASGLSSTVPGGDSNTATGSYSFAAGRRAKANATGSTVFADSQNSDLTNSTSDQFLIRARGGVELNTSSFTVISTVGVSMFSVDVTSVSVNEVLKASTATFTGPVTLSSATFAGVSVSTQAAGAAGASVTVTCPTGTFASGGGCDCASAASITEVQNIPNCQTAGCVPTGWTCQEPGSVTGGQCAAYVICSRLQ